MAKIRTKLVAGMHLLRMPAVRRFVARPWVGLAVVVVVLTAPAAIAYVLSPRPATLAATTMGNMYTQPEQLTVKKGQPVRVTVRIEPGTPIDTVTATLQYDAKLLTYTDVSYTESPFTTQIPATTTAARVTMQAAKFGGEPVAHDSLIAVVSFTGQKDGTATIDLTGNAARAGLATHPTVNGKTIPQPTQNGQNTSPPTSSTAANAVNAPSTVASSVPLASLTHTFLTKLGMSPTKANAVAPVLTLSVLVVIVVLLAALLYKRLRHRQLSPGSTTRPQGGHDEAIH